MGSIGKRIGIALLVFIVGIVVVGLLGAGIEALGFFGESALRIFAIAGSLISFLIALASVFSKRALGFLFILLGILLVAVPFVYFYYLITSRSMGDFGKYTFASQLAIVVISFLVGLGFIFGGFDTLKKSA